MDNQFNYFNCLHLNESNYEEAYKMAITLLNTMKRVSEFVNEFMGTDFDDILIRDEVIIGDPLRFRTFINHSIRAYDIKGVKAVVRKGHVYLVRDKNTA